MALSEVETFNPDAVIVDIAMPHLTGWDIGRQVRFRKGRRPLLIAITGASVETPQDAMSRAAGFDHFLRKPCEPSFLLNILAAVTPK